MKKLLFALGIIVIISFGFKSIFWGNCEEEKGKISRTTVNIDKFSKLKLHGSSTVYLSQGESFSVEIETTENIKDLLNTQVDANTWTIKFEKCINAKNGVKFYISMPEIDLITVSGSGDIIGKNKITSGQLELSVRGSGDIKLDVETKELNSSVKGSGDIVVEGQTEKQTIRIQGSGDYTAKDLRSQEAHASINGSGDININVEERLTANVNGSGDILYSGNPSEVDKKVNGSGDIEAK